MKLQKCVISTEATKLRHMGGRYILVPPYRDIETDSLQYKLCVRPQAEGEAKSVYFAPCGQFEVWGQW